MTGSAIVRRRRLNGWHRSRVLGAYRRGKSVAEAAQAAGVSEPSAYRILDDEGVFEPAVPVYPASLSRRAVELYVERRLSCRGVAALLAKRLGLTGSVRRQSTAATSRRERA